MFANLILSGLLAYGVATVGVHANNVSYNNNNNNSLDQVIVADSPSNDGHTVFGIYNWQDEFDFSSIQDNWLFNNQFVLDSEHKLTSPFTYGENFYFLESINFVYAGSITPRQCIVTFNYYDNSDNAYDKQFLIQSGDLLNTESQLVDYRDLIFKINVSLYLSSNEYSLWNCLFTTNDNQYVTSYDGYYNFFNVSDGINAQFSVVGGSIVFNNVISTSMWFNFAGFTKYVNALQYDVKTSQNTLNNYGSEFYLNHNILLSHVRMSKSGYNILSNIGSFSYVRDTQYDDTDFHDLLFTVMDTPIYFFSRLFDFQFFGVNLYIALSGLITLAVLVIIIRKIW